MALRECKECGKEISKKAKECPNCGSPQGTKGIGCIPGLIITIAVVAVIGSLSDNSTNVSSSSYSQAKSQKQSALENVQLDFKWNKSGFGSVMEADFVITNNNSFPIKDIEITCTHFANSGTKIDSNKRTIFEVVSANKSKTMSDFNMGFIHSQAASSSCSISDLKL